MAALAAVCVGVGLTNTGSGAAGTTTLGASVAVAAFTVTAFYQVWIGKKIKDFNVSSPQLLLNQAPISVLMLACMVPFFDTMPYVPLIPMETRIALILSGLVAALLVSFTILRIQTPLTSIEPFPISHHWKDECIDLQRCIQVSLSIPLENSIGNFLQPLIRTMLVHVGHSRHSALLT